MKTTIETALAGKTYPSDPGELLAFVRETFDGEEAPDWPVEADGDPADLPAAPELLGIVAPHIDLRVSMVAYAHAFEPLLRVAPVRNYLILGVGHSSRQEWSIDPRQWKSPLGLAPGDPELADALGKRVGPELLADPLAFEGEWSLEFPLVWLQALDRLRGLEPEFRLVPVLCGGLYSLLYGHDKETEWQQLKLLAEELRQWWDRQQANGGVRVVVSIDGCHQGPRFDHPYKMDEKRLEQTRAWEDFLWGYVERQDAEGMLHYLRQDMNARHFDGVGALMLLLHMFPEDFTLARSFYEQWFHPGDHSMVSFTSGTLTQS